MHNWWDGGEYEGLDEDTMNQGFEPPYLWRQMRFEIQDRDTDKED